MRRCASSRNDDGASSAEYALLVSLIAAIIVTIVVSLGVLSKKTYQTACDGYSNTVSGAGCSS